MARGGARPGAGRPRKSAVTPGKAPAAPAVAAAPLPAPPAPDLPPDVTGPAADAGLSPLDYMLQVMRDRKADPLRRDRMAMAAAAFVHIRPADAKPGKKEAAEKAAGDVAGAGKFTPSAPPQLRAVGGRS